LSLEALFNFAMFASILLMTSSLVLGSFCQPVEVDMVASRCEDIALDLSPATSSKLQKRDADASFDLGFRLTDKTLFSG
jgi:hypothetical protein